MLTSGKHSMFAKMLVLLVGKANMFASFCKNLHLVLSFKFLSSVLEFICKSHLNNTRCRLKETSTLKHIRYIYMEMFMMCLSFVVLICWFVHYSY